MLFFALPKLGLLATFLGCCTANLLTPFPISATEGALKYQPILDFGIDSCYQKAAIDVTGRVNNGLEADRREGRDNIRRCNHGWCAYHYGYCFEKDVGYWSRGGSGGSGWVGSYKHSWEHIVVWTLNDDIFYASWSAHGNYITQHQSTVRFEGTRPKIVYDRNGGMTTLSFRKADEKDDVIKNVYGKWIQSPLVSLKKMDCDINRKLLNDNWGIDLKKERFPLSLNEAMPSEAINNEHFEPWN